MVIIIIAVMALIAYSMIRAAAQADAQEAKFWAEREENERNDRTLVREEKAREKGKYGLKRGRWQA